jgi:hypothetical protein
MTELRTAFDDPRRRNLAVLASVALLAVLLAVLGVWRQARETAPPDTTALFFPDLARQSAQVAEIRIRSKKGALDIVFRPEKAWVVASRDDYPASREAVHETIAGLANLTTLEEKTARPDWLARIGLATKDATEITLLDDRGGVLASLLTGKTVDIGDPSGATGLFVRKSGDPQSWLVRSVFTPKTGSAEWLDRNLLSVDRTRIAEADVNPLTGPSYSVRRDRKSDEDFHVTDIPAGREVSYPGAPDAVGAAIVDLSFDDVKPARDFPALADPAHAALVVTRTFDGLTVTVSEIQQGPDFWATISAEGANPTAQSEARIIDAHVSGWAYKLPPYKGQQFATGLESLLKPLPSKGAPAPAH